MSTPRPARRRRHPVLDPERVRARRRELRLSTAALASALGTSAGVIARIEEGHGQEKLDLAFVDDLARSLGLPVAELIVDSAQGGQGAAPRVSREPDQDAVKLGSMVMHASGWIGVDDMCETLGWTIDRVLEGFSVLEELAPTLGLQLAWLGSDVSLVPAFTRETMPKPKSAGARHGLEIDGCRLLYRLSQGHSEHLLRRETESARRRLIALGLAANSGAAHNVTLELTDEARFSLCLPTIT